MQRITELKKEFDKIWNEMTELGLEHEIHIYHEGYSLLLEDDGWSGRERGEWIHSSETC